MICTPRLQVIYIAPLKALVRERMSDWGAGFCKALGRRMVELTGDFTPDLVGAAQGSIGPIRAPLGPSRAL